MRVAIQSVLYGNDPSDIRRAAEAAGTSAQHAVAAGVIAEWEYNLGDCSPTPVFTAAEADQWSNDLRELGGSGTYTNFSENLGSAAGHNRIASASKGELILIMNPDVRMAPGTISSLVKALRPGTGIAEARQLPLDHPKDYERFTGDTSWASTACAITPRSVFDELKGFDSESFFLYGDDVDYSWRVRLAGLRVVFEPTARVFHDKRLDIDGAWPVTPAEQYYSAESAVMLAHKYSAPERVASLLEDFASSRISHLERVAAAFRLRRANRELPQPIDPDHRVARFIGDFYADHRF